MTDPAVEIATLEEQARAVMAAAYRERGYLTFARMVSGEDDGEWPAAEAAVAAMLAFRNSALDEAAGVARDAFSRSKLNTMAKVAGDEIADRILALRNTGGGDGQPKQGGDDG